MIFDVRTAPAEADHGSDVRRNMLVSVETPRRSVAPSDVAEFFASNHARLSAHTVAGAELQHVMVKLLAAEGLTPPCTFLEALCVFLRDYPFPMRFDSTTSDQWLTVEVSEEADDLPAEIITEASTMIFRAYWMNEQLRRKPSLHADLPVIPRQEVMDHVFAETERNASPGLNLRVCENPREGSTTNYAMFIARAVLLIGVGPTHADAVARCVLTSSLTTAQVPLEVRLFSSPMATAVAASLRNLRERPLTGLSFVAGSGGDPVSIPVLDGADLFAAALLFPTLATLAFKGFTFSPETVAPAQEILPSNSAGASAMKRLRFDNCSFGKNRSNDLVRVDIGGDDGRNFRGLCNLAIAMAPSISTSLLALRILDTTLEIRDMKYLCTMFTGSVWSVNCGLLGGTSPSGEPCLSTDCVRHFFQHLPFMRTLVCLGFQFKVPASLTRLVTDGIKRNVSLKGLERLTFEDDREGEPPRLMSEVQSFVAANALGRDVVSAALAHPDNRERQEAALGVVHRLSNPQDPTNERDVDTARFLCLQLFLPACAARETLHTNKSSGLL